MLRAKLFGPAAKLRNKCPMVTSAHANDRRWRMMATEQADELPNGKPSRFRPEVLLLYRKCQGKLTPAEWVWTCRRHPKFATESSDRVGATPATSFSQDASELVCTCDDPHSPPDVLPRIRERLYCRGERIRSVLFELDLLALMSVRAIGMLFLPTAPSTPWATLATRTHGDR